MIRVRRINIKCDIELKDIDALKKFTAHMENAIADEEAEIYMRFEDNAVKFNPKLGTGPRSFETNK